MICCSQHRSALVPTLIYEYVVIRFRFKARNQKKFLVSKVTAQRHSSMKKSKINSTKVAVPSRALTKSHPQIETDKPYANDVTVVQPEEGVLCCNCPLPSKI
jgi:hypothetical protein